MIFYALFITGSATKIYTYHFLIIVAIGDLAIILSSDLADLNPGILLA